MLNPALKSSGLWTPRRLGPALALWIDPSDTTTMFQSNAGTTVVTNGSVCGFAGDKSGAAFHLTSAANDTTRPIWNSNTGRPYLQFTLATSTMLRRTADLGMYAAGACSVFFALRGNPGVDKRLLSSGNTGNDTPVYCPIQSDSATTTTASGFIRNDANSTLLASSTDIQVNAFDNTDRVYGVIDDGSNLTPYLNGVAGTAVPYTRSGALTVDCLSLGALLRIAAGNFWEGRIYGLVVANRAITAERQNLTTWLGAKMGLVL